MKVLFAYAHLDDETILAYGTMCKMAAAGHDITVAIACGDGRKNHDNAQRLSAFAQNMAMLGAHVVLLKHNDLNLELSSLNNELQQLFNDVKPTWVFTHSPADVHADHRTLFNALLPICRILPASSCKRMLVSLSKVGQHAFALFGNYLPNVAFGISNYSKQKLEALMRYVDAHEVPNDANDIRSPIQVMHANEVDGAMFGLQLAECFMEVYSIE